MACQAGDISTVRELITLASTHEASTPTDAELSFAITMAAANGYIDIINALLKYKPAVDCTSAFNCACTHGLIDVARILLHESTISATQALKIAALAITKSLITHKPATDCTSLIIMDILKQRPTPDCKDVLTSAVLHNRLDIVHILLEAQPLVYCKEAFRMAMTFGNTDMVRLFLSQSTLPIEYIQDVVAKKIASMEEWDSGIGLPVARVNGNVCVAQEFLSKVKPAVQPSAEKHKDEECDHHCLRP